MSMTYGPQGHARRGGMGGGGVSGQQVGSIAYDRVPPDASYVLADGRAISAAAYPEYAALMNMSPLPNVQLPNPATVPTGQCYPENGPCSLSDNGEWFVLWQTAGGTNVLVYNIVNGVQVYAATVSFPWAPQRVSVSNNGDIAIVGGSSTYTLTVAQRTPGTYTWTPRNAPSLTTAIGACCFTKDSQYIIAAQTAAPYLLVYKVESNGSLTAVTPSTIGLNFIPSSSAAYINRSLNGERWVFSYGAIQYICDYVNGMFSQIPVTPTFNIGYTPSYPPAFSADLTYFLTGSNTQMDLYSEPVRGQGYTRLCTYVFEVGGVYNAAFCGSDSYIVRLSSSAVDDAVYQILGASIIKAAPIGALVPGEYQSHFGNSVSRDGSTLVLSWQYPSYVTTVIRLGSPPPLIPIPAMTPQGYGPAKLNPYIKVRS